MAIGFAWTLHEHRKPLAFAGALTLLVLGLWRPWESFLGSDQLFRVPATGGQNRAVQCCHVHIAERVFVEVLNKS
jgi:hypothetical protein